jgi:hypothetical protein
VVEETAEKLGPKVSLRILSTDSEEARSQGIKSAILVFVDNQKIPIKHVLDRKAFEQIVVSHLRFAK